MAKISFKKIHNFSKKYYFYVLGTIFIILICFNFFIYYKYVYLLTNIDIGTINDEIKIDQQALQNVLDNINMREDNLHRIQTNKYFDPFN